MPLPQACRGALGPSLDKASPERKTPGQKRSCAGREGRKRRRPGLSLPPGIVPAARFCLHPAEGREGPASLCSATHRVCDGQLAAGGPALRDPTVQAH